MASLSMRDKGILQVVVDPDSAEAFDVWRVRNEFIIHVTGLVLIVQTASKRFFNKWTR